MRVVRASVQIESFVDGRAFLREIEQAGRVCYKSEERISDGSAASFVRRMLDSQHESVIEHASVTARFVVDRGVSHEIVRHRLASYSQESTRYCNYSKGRFDEQITVIDVREFVDPVSYEVWLEAMHDAEEAYFKLLRLGNKPEIARSVLPTSLKTEVVMTCNVREWRHFFRLRTAKSAHPQMREVAVPLLAEFRREIPVLFDDVEGSDG